MKIRVLALWLLMLCSSSLHGSEQDTVSTFAKAAEAIFNGDFVWGNTEKTFSQDELDTLKQYPDDVERLICAALNGGNSVVGAELMAYFDLKGCFNMLRFRVLEPGRYYGWEGTPDSDDAHLSDHQYVYHSRYLAALADLFDGEDLMTILALKSREIAFLEELANMDGNSHREWAQWMLYKLGI